MMTGLFSFLCFGDDSMVMSQVHYAGGDRGSSTVMMIYERVRQADK
jgi:hypothetical protein